MVLANWNAVDLKDIKTASAKQAKKEERNILAEKKNADSAPDVGSIMSDQSSKSDFSFDGSIAASSPSKSMEVELLTNTSKKNWNSESESPTAESKLRSVSNVINTLFRYLRVFFFLLAAVEVERFQ